MRNPFAARVVQVSYDGWYWGRVWFTLNSYRESWEWGKFVPPPMSGWRGGYDLGPLAIRVQRTRYFV